MTYTLKKNADKRLLKIAIVHDDFVTYGGGEAVLKVLALIYPEADFYTSYLNTDIFKKSGFPGKIKTTWLQNLGLIGKKPRIIQLLAPLVWPFLNLNKYDVIIIHGSFYLSNLVNLIKRNRCLTVFYSISPPKNLYFKDHRVWWELPLNYVYYPLLRFLDRVAVKNTDLIFSVSDDVRKRIRRIYLRDSEVIYPPVSVPGKIPLLNKNPGYYLYAGRLSREKKLDLLIESFNVNRLPLLIVGKGPEEKKLKRSARKNITFSDFKSGKELKKIMAHAKAFIHVAPDDDFPLAPIEALSEGTPLIVYKKGGTKEAVIAGKTGLVFRDLTVRSVNKAVWKAEKTQFNRKLCYEISKRYSEKRFKKYFRKRVSESYEKYIKT